MPVAVYYYYYLCIDDCNLECSGKWAVERTFGTKLQLVQPHVQVKMQIRANLAADVGELFVAALVVVAVVAAAVAVDAVAVVELAVEVSE